MAPVTTTSPPPTSTVAVISASGGPALSATDVMSLAALVLGAGAFVISFLQMIYQYYYSDLRDKCSSGAIGRWHFHVRTEWDIRNWRPRVLYPEVDLSIFKALDARHAEDKRITGLFKRLQKRGYRWVNIPGGKQGTRLFFIESGGWVLKQAVDVDDDDNKDEEEAGLLDDADDDEKKSVLVKRDRTIRIYQLPIAERLEWIRYLINNPRHSQIAARTSWANMLECLDVNPKALVKGKQLADIIPSSMDGPLQCTPLTNMGYWCLIFGMRELKIDYKKGKIEARNRYARITTTTQTVPGISNVISLEGDLTSLEKMVDEATTAELRQVVHAARGSLNFISFRSAMHSAEPFLIVHALQNGWKTKYYWEQSGKKVKKIGNLVWEATQFKQLQLLGVCPDKEEWTAFWKCRNVGTYPSIIQLLAFLPFHNICSGYPHELVMSPYLPQVNLDSKTWWNDEDTRVRVHRWLDPRILEDDYYPFVRPRESFLLMTIEGRSGKKDGGHSWIFNPQEKYQKMFNIRQGEGWKGTERTFRLRLTSVVDTCKYYNGRPQFPIHPTVFRLLDGESLESLRKEVQDLVAIDTPFVTVEAALLFTLVTLDARIEEMWREIEPQNMGYSYDDCDSDNERDHADPAMYGMDINEVLGPARVPDDKESKAEVEVMDEKNPVDVVHAEIPRLRGGFDGEVVEFPDDEDSIYSFALTESTLNASIVRRPSLAPESVPEAPPTDSTPQVTPHMAAFLAMWLSICRYVDPFAPRKHIKDAFNDVLRDWQKIANKDILCTEFTEEDIPTPVLPGGSWESASYYPGMRPQKTAASAMRPESEFEGAIIEQGLRKGEFCAWIKQQGRKHKILDMLPWLQLRTLLMYHYILCYEDCSVVAVRQNIEPLARVA